MRASAGSNEAAPEAGGSQAGAGVEADAARRLPRTDELNHDTVAMVAIDAKSRIAAGASSNGANHKVHWLSDGHSVAARTHVSGQLLQKHCER